VLDARYFPESPVISVSRKKMKERINHLEMAHTDASAQKRKQRCNLQIQIVIQSAFISMSNQKKGPN